MDFLSAISVTISYPDSQKQVKKKRKKGRYDIM